MENVKPQETESQVVENPFDNTPKQEVRKQAPVVRIIPEDPKLIKSEIKKTEEAIRSGIYKKKYQDNFSIPEGALIDKDKEVIEALPDQQDYLTRLKQKQSEIKSNKKPFLKRIAAIFLNL